MEKGRQTQTFHLDPKFLSLSRRGAFGQISIAVILVTIIPVMVLVLFWGSHSRGDFLSPTTIWVGGGCAIGGIMLGYALLLKYPVSIFRLRKHLSILAGEENLAQLNSSQHEDDLVAVQRYLERIVKREEDRVQMIRKQHDVELEAERQRVMVESIGTMCHHLGQPASVLSMNLYRFRNNPGPDEMPVLLAECEASYNEMSEILEKMRKISHYCSEPYLSSAHGYTDVPVKKHSRIIRT